MRESTRKWCIWEGAKSKIHKELNLHNSAHSKSNNLIKNGQRSSTELLLQKIDRHKRSCPHHWPSSGKCKSRLQSHLAICDNAEGPRGYYVKWSKKKKNIGFHFQVEHKNRINGWTNLKKQQQTHRYRTQTDGRRGGGWDNGWRAAGGVGPRAAPARGGSRQPHLAARRAETCWVTVFHARN